MSRLRRRPSPATLIALLALFVSLGGTSYAALVITGKNVKNNSLTGADIKNLKGADVKNNSLTGADVKNLTGSDVKNGSIGAADVKTDALTGGQINESTLGKVPSATNADHATNADKAANADHATNADKATNATQAANADATDGASLAGIKYVRAGTSAAPATLLNLGGLVLKATCDATNGATLTATTTVDNSFIRWRTLSASAVGGSTFNDFDTGEPHDVATTGANTLLNISLEYMAPGGLLSTPSSVSVNLAVEKATSFAGASQACLVTGAAINSPSSRFLITTFRKKR